MGGWNVLGHIPDPPPDPAEDFDQFSTTDPRELHRLLMENKTITPEANGQKDEASDQPPAIRQLAAIDLATLRTVLALAPVHARERDPQELAAYGIPIVYCCRRILVGKTPNLTAPVAALG